MAAGAEVAGLAGEGEEILVGAGATADPSEALLQETAGEELFHHLRDDRAPGTERRSEALVPYQAELPKVTGGTIGDAMLDDRPGEAFKLVMLSSMHISSDLWDTQPASIDGRSFSIPGSAWMVNPPLVGTRFELRGGTSAWKANAPAVEILLEVARRAEPLVEGADHWIELRGDECPHIEGSANGGPPAPGHPLAAERATIAGVRGEGGDLAPFCYL